MEWNCSILQQIAYRMRQSPSYMHSFVRATGSEKHKEERKKTGIFKDTQIFNWTRIDSLDQLQKTCSRRLRKWRKNWWKYKPSTRKSCVSSFSLKDKVVRVIEKSRFVIFFFYIFVINCRIWMTWFLISELFDWHVLGSPRRTVWLRRGLQYTRSSTSELSSSVTRVRTRLAYSLGMFISAHF